MVGRILEGDSTVMRPTEVGRSPDHGLDSPISGFCQARQLYDQPFNSAARSIIPLPNSSAGRRRDRIRRDQRAQERQHAGLLLGWETEEPVRRKLGFTTVKCHRLFE